MKTTMAAVMGAVLLCADGAPRAGGDRFRQDLDVDVDTRLEVENHAGLVLITGEADRDQVEILADHGDCIQVNVRRVGNVLLVAAETDCKGALTDFDLTVPSWMPVQVTGAQTEVEILGVVADIDVDVVDGEIYVHDSGGQIFLRSVQGAIEVKNCKGSLDVGSNNESIYLSDIEGQILAETLNGSLRMEGIVSSSVEGLTLNGDILYDGTMEAEGSYYFSSHKGDIDISVPENADLTVSVASVGGEFKCDFEVRPVDTQPGKRFKFVLGDGTGRLRIESFNGDIELFDPKGGRRKRGR